MSVDKSLLDGKIREMYPEIGRFGLSMSLSFAEDKKAWAVKLVHAGHELLTYVEPSDAEKCLGGVECVHLGHQIGQFVRNYCLEDKGCEY